MATIRKLEVPRDVLEYVAENLPGDARQIGGALNRLAASSQAWGRPMDLSLAREALSDLIRGSRPLVQIHDIERAVCDVFGLDTSKLQSPQKSKAVAHPRMLAMYLARKHTRAALSEIGSHFGRRSHTTVVSAEKAVNGWLTRQATLHVDGRTWNVDEAIRHIEGRLRLG
jgi:chromosomal replication initiator protein